jgi:Protein of unknown function (DUF2934)
MRLFWTIRYLDTRDQQFKNRNLRLDTDTLAPAMKAAIEIIGDTKNGRRVRELLRYRDLFQGMTEAEHDDSERLGTTRIVFLPDYFEDENGQELTRKRMAVTLTGNPEAEFFDPHFTKSDIDYFQAEKPPIDVRQIALTPQQLKVLGYFVRDLREMLGSAFYCNGPATLSRGGTHGPAWTVQTAASDEEICSFVTIFRRLCMEKEPANLAKAMDVFADALSDHPMGNWVRGIAANFESELAKPPNAFPFLGQTKLPFTVKRLIDVFIYTQYAHQPKEDRARQFGECLGSVNGDRSLLTFLFLTELWKCALHVRNAGVLLGQFYELYCQAHSPAAHVLASLKTHHPGIGALEKQEVKEARALEEKTEELARALWQQAGKPPGGRAAFRETARRQLLDALVRP